MYFPSSVTGWAVGDNGTILKTTTGGISPVNIISTEVPESFELYQNYPNPFNPVTHIGFLISDFGLVHLSIYDVLGKEVQVLIDEQMRPGSYEANWNAEAYPSGVYYYKLSAGDFTETKKMILIK
jgi:hypothetical protein